MRATRWVALIFLPIILCGTGLAEDDIEVDLLAIAHHAKGNCIAWLELIKHIQVLMRLIEPDTVQAVDNVALLQAGCIGGASVGNLLHVNTPFDRQVVHGGNIR